MTTGKEPKNPVQCSGPAYVPYPLEGIKDQIQWHPGETARPATPCLTASDPSDRLLNRLAGFAPSRSLSVSCCKLAAYLARRQHRGPSETTFARLYHAATSQIYLGQSLTFPFPRLSSLVRPASLHPFGGFGLTFDERVARGAERVGSASVGVNGGKPAVLNVLC